MSSTLHYLLSEYIEAGVIIAGDRNDLTIERLLQIENSLEQIVTLPTLNDKILDICATNLAKFYKVPAIIPPLKNDNP